MKILYAASEAQPVAASGGLADVAGSLPKALVEEGHEVCVVMPLYTNTIKKQWREKMNYVTNFSVPVGWRNQYCGLFTAEINGVTYYFLDNEYYFKRDFGLYGYYDAETLELLDKGINPIDFSNIRLSVSAEDSKKINLDESPKVIISASGMCEAGRIRHHLKHNLWRAESTILFVGYQADGTLGRKLLDGADIVSLFNEEIAVHANITSVVGISGHADRDMMLEWIAQMPDAPKRIFVNHGEDMVCESFSQTIYNKLVIPSCAPFSGDEYDLVADEFTARGKVVKVSKISDGRRRANIAFDKLLSAGKRLLTIIGLSKNTMTNKEMAKFTDQIHDLCDKYARKVEK